MKKKMENKFLGTFEVEEAAKRIGKRQRKVTHISLFTGAGGLDLGFAAAGIETRVMIEFDKGCCNTLRANWHWEELKKRSYWHYEIKEGKRYNGDIYTGDKTKSGEKLKYVEDKLKWKNKEEFLQEAKDYKKELQRRKKSKKKRDDDYQFAMKAPPATWYQEREPVIFERDIKEVTTEEILKAADLEIGQCGIVSGGAPCQGFSLAGKRMIDDPRNFLFKEMVRIIKGVLPRFIMFENVPGLQSMNKGKTIKEMMEEFANCGYDIMWKILNAADYGVPQNRKRIIMIGTRIDAMVMPEKGNVRVHIAAMPGEIRYPKQWMEKYGIKLGVKEPEQSSLKEFKGKSK